MSLRLYDTSARTIREFVPVAPGRASLYLCGATVQAPPHIGHVRSGVNFDILRRWLLARGYAVTYCRNVTDIDDKIIHVAGHEGLPWWAVSERNQRTFSWSYDMLGCLAPTVEPRATGHVPEMIILMRRLIEAGHAYASEGDVYFDVASLPAYGSLSNQRIDHMRGACDTDSDGSKRDVRDFALWKRAKPGEPSWETPWGPGRPGWHLECSAMATKYLGETFDIHAGGVDLIFPHHENEIAQSQAAGDGFARYWVHNGMLNVSGEKMSKSIGNSLLVTELVKRVRPVELRYYLGQAHYRSVIDYSEEALQEGAAAYRRLESFVTRAAEMVGNTGNTDAGGAACLDGPAGDTAGDAAGNTAGDLLPAEFAAALDDDLGVPQALAVVHRAVREGNSALANGDKESLGRALAESRAMLDVLGLDPLAPQWSGSSGATGGEDLHAVLDQLVALALEQRAAARSRKDYATADRIRGRLTEAGVAVEDTPQGTRWELRH